MEIQASRSQDFPEEMRYDKRGKTGKNAKNDNSHVLPTGVGSMLLITW